VTVGHLRQASRSEWLLRKRGEELLHRLAELLLDQLFRTLAREAGHLENGHGND